MDLELPNTLDTPLVRQAVQIWVDGGQAMIAIAVVALVLFAVGVSIYVRLMAKRFEWSWRSAVVIAVAGFVLAFVAVMGSGRVPATATAVIEVMPQLASESFTHPRLYVHPAVLVGIGAGVLWLVLCTLPGTDLSSQYAALIGVVPPAAWLVINAVSHDDVFLPLFGAIGATAWQAVQHRLFLFGVAAAAAWGLASWGLALGCTRWKAWVHRPNAGRGPIGRLIRFATGARTIDDTARLFDEMRSAEVKPFDRDFLIMRVCVAAAPLLGLLGTVVGMVATFDALNQGSGGDETQGLVSDGISVALITTETGLVIALAGLFFKYQLEQKHQRYKAFIAQMETLCTQAVYQKHQQHGGDAPHAA